LPFPEQDARDHETRDDEEHVHADVSARQTGDSCVEEDDGQDGDCPKTFDVGTEATIAGGGTRLATRGEEPGVDWGLLQI
jgi:hypothetical protein